MKKNKKEKKGFLWKSRFVFGLGWILFLGMGCKDDPIFHQPPRKATLKLTTQKNVEIELPQQKELYTSVAKRDPFRPSNMRLNQAKLSLGKKKKKKKKKIIIEPLRRFALNQLKIVGVVTGTSSPLATIQTPDKEVHVSRLNSYLGNNNGQIVSILPEGVIVLETTRDTKTKRLLRSKTLLKIVTPKEGNLKGRIFVGKKEAFLDKRGNLRYYHLEEDEDEDS